MAVDDAALTINEENGDRVGVITGCGLGGLRFMEDTILTIHHAGPKRVSPFFIPMMIGNMAPGMIPSSAKGLTLLATACAASTVGDSFKIIQRAGPRR
jgi:3-oxoacyl-[acyl-carrier-protein] synthase II